MRLARRLSVITRGASVVLAPKREAPIRHIEFVSLAPDRALVVLVFADGQVENRIFAAAGANAVLDARGRQFPECAGRGADAVRIAKPAWPSRSSSGGKRSTVWRGQLVESGLALWENAGESSERLIVRGRST
jgi:heat-inducible transcriptional repressor